MAEFCLKCLQKFEPNANKDNTTVSINPYYCDGCGELKPIVVTFNEFDEDDMMWNRRE